MRRSSNDTEMQEHLKKKSTKQLETAAAALRALETAKSGGRRRKEWLAIRKKAGRKIDPETAEIMWKSGYALDPYRIGSRSLQAYQQLQRNYFARSPGSDTWVFFYDLPTATRHALWKKHRAWIAFRLQDSPEESQTPEELLQREKLKLMERYYDALEVGKSIEEIEIMIDISAAADRIPESWRKIGHEALDLIKTAQWEGLSRKEAMAYLREIDKGAV